MSILIDALSRASVPVEFVILFIGTSIGASVLLVGLLIAADRERQEREKRGHRGGG